MASAHRYLDRSPHFLACFHGPDGDRVQMPTKCSTRSSALNIALALEKAASMARDRILSQAKAKLILESLAPLNAPVMQRVRKLLNEWIELSGGDPLSEHTVRGWCLSWVENREPSLAEETSDSYRRVITEFLKELGEKADRDLNDLSVQCIKNFRDKQIADGVRNKTANFFLKTLKTCFKAAIKQGYLQYNRAEGVDQIEERSAYSGDEDDFEKEPFIVDEVEKLVLTAPSREWRELTAFGYYTGGRLGDLVALCFENIDLVAGTVSFKPRKQRRSHKAKSLTIPVHIGLLDLIRKHGRTHGPIFPTLCKRRVGGKTGLSLLFRRIMDQAGIRYKTKEAKGRRGRRVYSKGFHSLRHTTNSLLANKNVPQEQRLEIMGQASLDVNDGYTKFDRETKRQAINQLPTLRFGGTGRGKLKAPKSVESTLLLSTP